MTQVATSATNGNAGVKSARRAMHILEVVSDAGRALTFPELSELLGYPKSSLHGLLSTMVDMRWLNQDPTTRAYHIGIKAWEVGQQFQRSRDLVRQARRHLRSAQTQIGETVQLGILDGLDVVYLDKVEGTRPLRLVSDVGARIPAYATALGKCLLAALPEEELTALFGGRSLEVFTLTTIQDGDALLEVLRSTQERGYATDDGEYTSGVYCIAVPVLTAKGTTIASMSCSVPRSRVDLGELDPQFILRVLQSQAEQLAPNLDDAFGAPSTQRLSTAGNSPLRR